MGIPNEITTTNNSRRIYNEWKGNDCQPNFWANISEARTSCGPYHPQLRSQSNYSHTTSTNETENLKEEGHRLWQANKMNHDTIGIVTMDENGSLACGTSTNGANHKIAGRVGDSPIPGAGCYVNSKVGGAAATGDGDVMMRFLPSAYAVNLMEARVSPKEACQHALDRINKVFPTFAGGMVCVTKDGVHAGAANNMGFAYSYMTDGMSTVGVVQIS